MVGDADALMSAVAAAGATPVPVDAVAAADADVAAVVATGERAVCATCCGCPPGPILPVDAGAGFRSVAADEVEPAVKRLLAGEWGALAHPVVAVTDDARAVADVTLVTAPTARISEYSIWTDGTRVASVRADGVTVAFPAGSGGYARAAGGPTVAPGTGVAAVVPIAPFATDPDHWVLPIDGVSLTVERDEAAVELVVDGQRAARVEPGVALALSRVGTARTAVVPESRPFF